MILFKTFQVLLIVCEILTVKTFNESYTFEHYVGDDNIDVGDGCRRRNVLVTTLQFRPFSSPIFNIV